MQMQCSYPCKMTSVCGTWELIFKKYQCITKLFEWISHYIACVNQASTFIHPNTARKVSKVEAQNIFLTNCSSIWNPLNLSTGKLIRKLVAKCRGFYLFPFLSGTS